MLGRSRPTRMVMINVWNHRSQQSSSRADRNPTFEKLKNAFIFLLPTAGMLAFFVINNPISKGTVQGDRRREILSEYLLPRIKRIVPNTKDYVKLVNNKEYISRASIEKEISRYISRVEANGSYCIIYGSAGVGKTIVVEAVAHGRPGILKVKLTNAENGFFRELVELTGTSQFDPTREMIQEILSKAVLDKGILPTVIFEVETASDYDGLHAARLLCKDFASVCNCIMVVAELDDVVQFRDSAREKFIFVGELNENETREYVKQHGMMLNENDIKKVFNNIGSNPAILKDLKSHLQEGLSLDDFIAMVLRDAKTDLVAFQHPQILKALKDHPEGITPMFLKRMESHGVNLSDPRAVGVEMRRWNAIIYRPELHQYMTYSKAHEVALRSYDPILPRFQFTC